MSKSRQYFNADRIVVATFFVVKFFGLWPYEIKISKQNTYNKSSLIYSILLPIFLIIGYVYVGTDLLNESWQVTDVFKSLALQLVVEFYSYTVIISYFILYFGQYIQQSRKRAAYIQCIRVSECMRHYSTENVDDKPFVNKFILKTIVYDLINFALFYYNLTFSSNTINSQPYLSLFVFLPIYAIRLSTNVFYGGILYFNILYKQVNQSLDKIILGKIGRDINAAQLQFEKASIVYMELAKGVKAFNLAFTFQITIWISTQLIILTTQYFYQYIALAQLMGKDADYIALQHFATFTAIFMSMYELFSTANACNSLVKEARLATVIIHKMNTSHGLKLKNVDTFSIWMSLNRLAITDCGMFELDLRTMRSAFSAILSYFVILIQFELAM